MDTDLFQILTLILLLGLLLTLFGVLQSLGAIRKSLEGRGSSQTAAAPAATEASRPATETVAEPAHGGGDEEPATWARPETAAAPAEPTPEPEPEAARTGWPAPQEAEPTPEPATIEDRADTSAAPAAATSTGTARVLYGDAGLTSATPSEAALRPAESASSEPDEATPAAQSGTGQAGAQTDAGAAQEQTQSSAADDPQEQPFERDGRWWFRRGDELLVYEEQTGQWVAAPEPSTSGSVAAAAPAETGGGESAPASTEGQVTTQQEAVGSFWKCPSCGAVNGSTATSCRMCFTARP